MGTLDKIIAILESQKKDQKELTDYLGLQKGTFTKWKAGKNQSYLKYMEKISDFFSVPVSYFYEDKKTSLPSDNDKLDAEIMRLFTNLPKEQKEVFIQLAKQMNADRH